MSAMYRMMENGYLCMRVFCLYTMKTKNILTWQFTRSTAFDEVAEVLRSLHRRISCLGGAVDTIIIDNCCQWRNKLQCLFGQEVDVKLDLLHAVQRVTRKLLKRHPYFHACSQDFQLVMRDTGDHGPLRQQTTPSPETINRNLDHFVENGKILIKMAGRFCQVRSLLKF